MSIESDLPTTGAGLGLVKTMSEAGPTSMENTALVVTRFAVPEEVRGTVKLAVPWTALGVMVKVQPSPEVSRTTVESSVVSIAVAVPQVMV